MTYFNSCADAVQYAKEQTEKKGFEINQQDWFTKINLGGKYSRLRPNVDEYKTFIVGLIKNDKEQRKCLSITLYGMQSGKFELTFYVN